MNPSADSPLYVLMFVAGCAVPTMAALNAMLGARLGSPLTAVLVLTSVAALTAAVALVLGTAAGSPLGWRGDMSLAGTPPALWFGGVLFIVYILSATVAVPRIGLGNAIFVVLLGQLITSATIDHFGLFGAPVSPIDWRRVAGIALMVAGIALARRDVVAATTS